MHHEQMHEITLTAGEEKGAISGVSDGELGTS